MWVHRSAQREKFSWLQILAGTWRRIISVTERFRLWGALLPTPQVWAIGSDVQRAQCGRRGCRRIAQPWGNLRGGQGQRLLIYRRNLNVNLLAENISTSACILTSSLPHSRGTKKYPNATSSCIFQIAPHSFSAPPLTSTLYFSFQKQYNHTCSVK